MATERLPLVLLTMLKRKICFVLTFFFLNIFTFYSSQAYASAVVARRQQMQKMAYEQQMAQQKAQQGAVMGQQLPGGARSDPSQEVDFKEIVNTLKTSSEVWIQMMDPAPKRMIVEQYMNWYKSQGVSFGKDAAFYVQFIDEMAKGNPDLLKAPFKDVLRLVAIMEYDFWNGQNKEELARRVLGEKLYEQNKKRLGL